MVISVLKGDFDAAVVIQDYWTLIAESLRENQLSVIKVYEIKPDSNFYGRDSYSELTPNIFPDFKTGSVSWGEPSPNKNPAKLLRTLLQQKLDQFNDQQSK